MISTLEKQMLTALLTVITCVLGSLQRRLAEVKAEMDKLPVDYTEEIKVNQ